MTETESIQLPLRLRARRGELPDRADAWFIPGSDPRTWLDEICRWGIATEPMRLLVVPQSRANRAAIGVLVVTPAAPKTTTLAEPCVRIGAKLYVPASSVLYPPISEGELNAALRLEVNLMHPSIGLIGCATDELLSIADLLEAPPPAPVEWGLAVPGVAAQANLRSVKPREVPGVEEFFEQSRDGIGSEDPTDLPKLPSESKLGNLMSGAAIGGLSALNWLGNHLGGAIGAAGSGAFSQWTANKLAALRNSLDEARGRELSRLMNLLQTNPDEGLRYALPLNAPNSGRGVGMPGWRLGRRDLNFSLGGLFSSAPGDPWQLSWEMHQRLMNKYRELASRELSLGRYRRAAYIFGQLLHDIHSAANALKQGRFFREAAVLYRDQLQDKAAAAECLEEGGLLVEAIELYDALKKFEKVGDLYRKLNREDEATRYYRLAARVLQSNGDTLRAARLLESKLSTPDEAIELLNGAWPDAPQAAACLEESFALLGRLARHDDAIRRISHFRDNQPSPNRALSLADVLANVATSHPSFDVRAAAADATRVVVGNRLPAAPSSEAYCLVNAAVRIASDDRLLIRDGQRFIDGVNRQSALSRKALPDTSRRAASDKVKPPVLVRTFRLGSNTNWMAALSIGSTFFAQGVREDEVVVMRVTWDGTMQQISWNDPSAPESSYRLCMRDEQHLMLIPASPGVRRQPNKRFPRHDAFRGDMTAGTPVFFPPDTVLDAAVDEAATIWVLHQKGNDPNLLLSAFSAPGGALRSSEGANLLLEAGDMVPESLHLIVRAGHACISCGTEVWDKHSDKWRNIDLRDEITSVAASPLHTRLRLAITFPEGACLFWPDGFELQRFAQQLVDPLCCILRDATLVAIGRRQGMLYAIDGQQVRHLATFDTDPTPPVAVLPAHDSNHFATLNADGLVRVYRRA